MTEDTTNFYQMFPSAFPLYNIVRETGEESQIELKREIDDILKNVLTNPLGNIISVDKHVMNRPGMKNLNLFFKEHIDNYVENVLCPKNESLEFYITQSWINSTRPDENHAAHIHPNSIVSGVYYFTDMCEFILHNPFVTELFERNTLYIESKGSFWNFSQETVRLVLKQNTLLLFPSWIKHEVPKNQSSSDRISLSFNVFVKGDLGDPETLDELRLR